MKTYTYTVFLRHPKTKETQHGIVEFDHEGFMDCHALFEKLANSEAIRADLNSGYTLITMQIVSVS